MLAARSKYRNAVSKLARRLVDWQNPHMELWRRFNAHADSVRRPLRYPPSKMLLHAITTNIRDVLYPCLQAVETITLMYHNIHILTSEFLENNIAHAAADRAALSHILDMINLRLMVIEQQINVDRKGEDWLNLWHCEVDRWTDINKRSRRLEHVLINETQRSMVRHLWA